MANRERGEVTLSVGDRRYTLRLEFNALCEIEDLLGKPVKAITDEAAAGSMRAIRALLWAMLQARHRAEFPSITEAGNLITEVGLDAIKANVGEAFDLNAAQGAGEANPPSAQAGTGGGSTPTPAGSA